MVIELPKVPSFESAVLYKLGAKEILEYLSKIIEERFSNLAKLDVFRTTATLAHRLRELEIAGYIVKSIHNRPGYPVKIYYKISEKGQRALELLRNLENL